MTNSDISSELARLDAEQDKRNAVEEGGDDVRTVYRCECSSHEPSMDAFVDHVSDEHNALDIAVQALLDADLDVPID